MDVSKYKAILFDVDKTLTNSQKQISEKTISAIQKLHKTGLHIGVCTGRHFATLHTVLPKMFPAEAVHVLCSGAQLATTAGVVQEEFPLDPVTIQKLITLSKDHSARIVIQSGKKCYGNEKAVAYKANYNLADEPELDVLPLREFTGTAPLVILGHLTDASIEELALLPITYKLMTNYDGQRYTDVTAQGVTKAVGVEAWCRVYNLHPEEVIGFGDSENDLEFLQSVGYAVAMGNASDAVKAISDEVIADCDHDGVAEWIENRL